MTAACLQVVTTTLSCVRDVGVLVVVAAAAAHPRWLGKEKRKNSMDPIPTDPLSLSFLSFVLFLACAAAAAATTQSASKRKEWQWRRGGSSAFLFFSLYSSLLAKTSESEARGVPTSLRFRLGGRIKKRMSRSLCCSRLAVRWIRMRVTFLYSFYLLLSPLLTVP